MRLCAFGAAIAGLSSPKGCVARRRTTGIASKGSQMAKPKARRAIIREWMALTREKRQSGQQALAFAKASACWPDCRFSRVSAIHSRIMARRAFGLAIWLPFEAIPVVRRRATQPFGLDRPAIAAPKAHNRIHAQRRAR